MKFYKFPWLIWGLSILLKIIFQQLNAQSGGRRSEDLIGENGLLKLLFLSIGKR
jgi:hypothetical protein